MKIGISPIGWTNDDMPSLGADNTFEKCIAEMAEAGYEGCEIGVKFPRDIQYLKNSLKKHGLQICNQWFDFRLTTEPLVDNLKRLSAHIHFLQQLDCPIIGGGEVGMSCQKQLNRGVFKHRALFLSERQKKEFYQGLNECGALIESKGMKLAFHHHMGSVVQSLEEVLELLDNTDQDNVGLNYDSGHFAFSGDEPIHALEQVIDRVNHVHLKNIRTTVLNKVKSKEWSFLKSIQKGVFTAPGDPEGSIDFSVIFNILLNHRYDKWVVVEAEQNPDEANPLKYAIMAKTLINQELGK